MGGGGQDGKTAILIYNMQHFRLVGFLALGFIAFAEQPELRLTQYVVGIRLKGPSWKADLGTEEGRRMIEGHIAVIKKMTATGKLVAAGPFNDPTELRGLLIFRDCTIEQARQMDGEDPVVKSGQITIEFHTWMAPPGLKADQ